MVAASGTRHLGRGAKRRFWLAVVIVGFVTSRAIYRFGFGAQFDFTPMFVYLQFADAELLREELLTTVWHLHGQAPLMSLLAGIGLKLSPRYCYWVFELFFFAGGLLFSTGLYGLLARLGPRHAWAASLTILYAASPLVAVYERWLLYHHPVAVLLVATAILLARFGERRSLWRGIALFGCMAALVLTRNIFGFVWVFAILAGSFVFRVASFRRLMLSAAPALALLLGFAVKQYALFGTPGVGQAFVGPNIAMRVRISYPTHEVRAAVQTGRMPAILGVRPVKTIDRYEGLVTMPPPTGVRVLDQTLTSTDRINLHHRGYPAVGEAYARAAREVIARDPSSYTQSIRRALEFGYFRSASYDAQVRRAHAYQALKPLVRFTDRWLGYAEDGGNSWLVILLYPLVLFATGVRLIRRLWMGRVHRTHDALRFFMLTTILYVSLATVLVSWGDYARYRFGIDALYFVLGVSLLRDLLVGLRRRFRVRSTSALQ